MSKKRWQLGFVSKRKAKQAKKKRENREKKS
jgi:hypothetical protein